MSFAIGLFFCVLAFVLAASGDALETRYVRAVRAWEEADAPGEKARARERAARSSVLMWLVGIIAWIGILEAGWYVIIPEGLGLYCGTKWAMRH